MHAGIYLHIPFCVQRCNYCDFVSNVAQEKQYTPYIQALYQEMALYAELFPDIIIDTIYFGGGTPSILPVEHIQGLMQQLQTKFNISLQAEITIETNPGTANLAAMKLWHLAGINRISMGVQATQDNLLQTIGRIHTLEEAQSCIDMAKIAGFSNISVDLMYGLPGQTLKDFKESVAWATSRGIQHISIYGLQVEENTMFGKLAERGELILPSEEISEEMYDYLVTTLPLVGFKRYEISNYAKVGYESQHNMSYWQDKMYLGLGAGAHGYYNGKRIANYTKLEKYMRSCEQRQLPIEETMELTEKEHIEEVCFLSLRTAKGIDKELFKLKFGKTCEDYYGEIIPSLIAKGLLEDIGSYLRLTQLGMKFGNQVFEAFII